MPTTSRSFSGSSRSWAPTNPRSEAARFRTVALAFFPDGRRFVAEGASEGSIAPEALGNDGFGYDPVFVPADGDGRTFAEMSSIREALDVAPRTRLPCARRRLDCSD